jgi:rRNA maturation RNase YbeY
MKQIYFHSENAKLLPARRRLLHTWIVQLFAQHNKPLHTINYIFCTDAELLEINNMYLNHDTYTDIITFDNTENIDSGTEADIYISVERTKENAQKYKVLPATELHRVMAHGVLHLIGYKDKTPADKTQMTQQENQALLLLTSLAQ